MRELTDDEIALINENLAVSGQQYVLEDSDEGGAPTLVRQKKDRQHSRFRLRLGFLGRPAFWGSLFVLFPFIIALFIYSITSRVDSILGSGAIETLSKLSDSELANMGPEGSGFDWLPEIITLYENRDLIIVVTFSVCLLIAAALFFWQFKINAADREEYVNEANRAMTSAELKESMDLMNEVYENEDSGYDPNEPDTDTESEENTPAEAAMNVEEKPNGEEQ